MSGVTVRRKRRPGKSTWVVAFLAAALLLGGCSAGQLTQTAEQEAAINGTDAHIGAIDLENIYLHAELAEEAEAIYGNVRLAFTAVNTSLGEDDRLLEIGSPAAASVEIEASDPILQLKPESRLAAGQPVQNVDPTSAPDERITVAVTMKDIEVYPGLTFPFDFTFAKAGSVRVQVPFDVWTPGESQQTKRPLPPTVEP